MKCSHLKRKSKITEKVSGKKRRTKSPRRTCLRCGLRSSSTRCNRRSLRFNTGRKAKNETNKNFKEQTKISHEKRREMEKVFLGRTISAIDRAYRNRVQKQKTLKKLQRIGNRGIKKEKKIKLKVENTKDEDTKVHFDIPEPTDVSNNKIPDSKEHNQESFTDKTHKDETQDERPACSVWENENNFTPDCNVRENVESFIPDCNVRENVKSFIPDCNVWENEKLSIPDYHVLENLNTVSSDCSIHENEKTAIPNCSVWIMPTEKPSIPFSNVRESENPDTQYSYIN